MKVDIDDINYIISHEELNLPNRKEKYTSSIFSLFLRWAYVVFKGTISIPYFFFDYYKDLPSCKYFFWAFTSNNMRALTPIHNCLHNSCFYDLNNPLPLKRIWWHALLYSPILFYKYIIAQGYLKKAYASDFNHYCQAYGYYVEAKNILKKINPEMVILSNDHSFPSRSFLRAAESLNIKTVYVQHASVTDNFPSLAFDYAFLDGRESYEKYIANNKECKSLVFLSGCPRFDIIKTFTTTKKADVATLKCGVAVSFLDQTDRIEYLINKLLKNIPDIQITLRPHPGMQKEFWKNFCAKNLILLSDSKSENPFEFINNNNFFIAGESSFHLDVALSNKKSYYYNFTGELLDWYGYLQNKVMTDITDLSDNDLINSIEHPVALDSQIISYYVSNYNTEFWGKCGRLIADTISEIIVNSTISKVWRESEPGVYEISIIPVLKD